MRIAPSLLLILLFTAATACTTPTPAPPTPAPPEAAAEPRADGEPEVAREAPAVAPDPASAHTLCWETEEEISLAAGGEQPGARRLLRLRLEPEAGRVVNETLRFDPNPDAAPQLFTTTWTVDGDSFELSEAERRISGAGTLLGEAWNWSGWSADSRLSSGIRIHEEAAIATDGVLTLEREVFGPDGSRVMTLEEEGRPVSESECDERMAESRPD